MVNVLPRQVQRQVKRGYYVRLGTVFFSMLAGVFLVGVVSLIPSYIASSAQADSFERYRDALRGTVGFQEQSSAETEMRSLEERVRIARDYGQVPFSANLFEALLRASSSDLAVFSISFVRNGSAVRADLSGVADTRDDLLAFVEALRSEPSLSSVTLPVAQLVQESQPPFSIHAEYHTP